MLDVRDALVIDGTGVSLGEKSFTRKHICSRIDNLFPLRHLRHVLLRVHTENFAELVHPGTEYQFLRVRVPFLDEKSSLANVIDEFCLDAHFPPD